MVNAVLMNTVKYFRKVFCKWGKHRGVSLPAGLHQGALRWTFSASGLLPHARSRQRRRAAQHWGVKELDNEFLTQEERGRQRTTCKTT